MLTRTAVWHFGLCVVAVFNLLALAVIALSGWADSRQLPLTATYVIGCAFRSFLPRAGEKQKKKKRSAPSHRFSTDLQRIVVVDHWLSAVFWGRTVATIAELAFAQQLAIVFDLPFVLPLLIVAEAFSWFAILTNRAIFNMLENSLWTVCGAVIALTSSMWLVRIGGALFVLFMVTTDLPMYWRRHCSDKRYRSVAAGLRLLLTDFRVTVHDDDWRDEWHWMAGYFSIFVWTSLWFAVKHKF